MVSLHGILFREFEGLLLNVGCFWPKLRMFFYKNKTLFDITFLGLYTFEQLTLFLLILLLPDYSPIFAGVFAILFISTISFEKVCMESRYKFLEANATIDSLEKENITEQYGILAHNNEQLRLALGSKLNKKK